MGDASRVWVGACGGLIASLGRNRLLLNHIAQQDLVLWYGLNHLYVCKCVCL